MGCKTLDTDFFNFLEVVHRKKATEKFILGLSDGYVEPNNGSWQYVYQYRDHLDNIRLTYADLDGNGSVDANTEIIEENSYYPFGLKMHFQNNVVSANVNSVASKFKYNGKELNDELGLGWYDLGARNYDPSLARFMTVDPKAEDYYYQSTYAMAANNPIYYIDINGEGVLDDYKLNQDGTLELIAETDTADRVFATDHNDKITEKSITLERDGQIAEKATKEVKIKGTEEIVSVDNIEFNDEFIASEAFEFFSDNSEVEWSFVTAEGSNSYVGTTHTIGSTVSGNLKKLELIREGFDNIIQKHSHPRPRETILAAAAGVVTFSQTPSLGDLANALKFHQNHPNINVRYSVYDAVFGGYYGYSHREYQKPVSTLKSTKIKEVTVE